MPTRGWSPTANDCILLDSNIIQEIGFRDKPFKELYLDLIRNTICKNSPEIFIPQIVECELIGSSRDLSTFNNMLSVLTELQIGVMPTEPEMLRLGAALCAMYKWKNGKKKIKFHDMVIAATAAVYEQTTKKCTYILSVDREDFIKPYVREISDYLLEIQSKKTTRYIQLYRSERYIMNKHWKGILGEDLL